MANKIAYNGPPGVCLIGGLDWVMQPVSGSADGHLRDGASARAASHATVASATTSDEIPSKKGRAKRVHRRKAGFYSSASGAKLPKGSHSLAAAFAAWTNEHESALLNVRMRNAEGHYAVVVVVNGLPVFDKIVETKEQARDVSAPWLSERPSLSIFSDDIESYPRSLAWDDLLEKIAGATGPATALKPVPVDVAKLALIALVVVSAAGGYWYYKKAEAEKARQRALAAQRAADPVPKYLNALANSSRNAGIDRASLKAALLAASRIPLAPDGWVAKRIACSGPAGCEVVFARTTGTVEGLRAAVPFLDLAPATGINFNEARMTWQQDLKPAGLVEANALPSIGAFVQGADASQLQTWLVAGVSLQLAPPALWPQVPGVPPTFKHPKAIAAGKFEASAIALPQLAEAVEAAPANVSWAGWIVELGDLKQEALSRAQARLIGAYYVKNN